MKNIQDPQKTTTGSSPAIFFVDRRRTHFTRAPLSLTDANLHMRGGENKSSAPDSELFLLEPARLKRKSGVSR